MSTPCDFYQKSSKVLAHGNLPMLTTLLPSQNQNRLKTLPNSYNFDFNDKKSLSFLCVSRAYFVKKEFARFARFLSFKGILQVHYKLNFYTFNISYDITYIYNVILFIYQNKINNFKNHYTVNKICIARY